MRLILSHVMVLMMLSSVESFTLIKRKLYIRIFFDKIHVEIIQNYFILVLQQINAFIITLIKLMVC